MHRLVRGGWATDPTLAWAAAHGLDPAGMPRPAGGDLFDFAGGAGDGDAGDPDSPVRSDGYLRPEAADGSWLTTPERVRGWAAAALETAALQQQALADRAAAGDAAPPTRSRPPRCSASSWSRRACRSTARPWSS